MLFVKSLAVFVAVGVAAGLAFGVYLIDVRQAGQLEFVEGPSLSIVTEKSDFEKGEPIRIKLVNSGTADLAFPDTSYGLRITGLSGVLFYSQQPAAEAGLKPGEEVEFVWDQDKNNDDYVLEGIYKIHSKGASALGEVAAKPVTITIWK